MKICIAQTKAVKREIHQNMANHIRIIQFAIQKSVDLIIFPELSITGYEPALANELAMDVNDDLFQPFQDLADKNDIIIGLGAPTIGPNGINISMLIFQPKQNRIVYSKQMLHQDELPYFVKGINQPFLEIRGKKIGIGICYETLQRKHFINAINHNIEIYIASVAKPDRGLDKACVHFPSLAKEFGIPVLMSNCVGYCDNFLSNVKSAVWNEEGLLLQQLNEIDQGVIVYDTSSNTSNKYKITTGI